MIFSLDLRERVIAAVKSEMHVNEVVKLFKVSQRVIYNWIKLDKKIGNLSPKTGYQKGHSHKIVDWEQFKKFSLENKDCTAAKMAIKWTEMTGAKISRSTILKALKTIGFTFKKKNFSTRKLIQKKDSNTSKKLAL